MNNLEEILNVLKQRQEQQGGATVETVEEQPNRFKADGISVSRGEVSSLSKQFTDLLNVFGKLANSEKYVAGLQQSVNVAEQNYASERSLESRSISQIPAPQGSVGEDLAGVLSGITNEIDLLSKSIQENGLGGQGGDDKEKQSEDSGSSLGSMLKTAAIAGAVALGGYLAGSASPARAAPRPSDGYGEGDNNHRFEGGGGSFGGGGASGSWQPAAATPQITRDQSVRTSKYSDALSGNIKAGIEVAQTRSAAPTSGYGDGGSDGFGGGDSYDGAAGGEVNPPTSGMAGLIYNEGKRRGYDDYMSVAFVAVAEKESGLKPTAENMVYTADRAKAVFKRRAPQPHTTDPRAFANHVYATTNGNQGGNDGWTYRGKGLNQLTGRGNYAAIGRRIGYDLVKDPDALLKKPEIAVKAMFEFYEGHRVLKGKRSARNQSEANRLVTDATAGKTGFSSDSAFGRENLDKVNRFSAKYSAGGLASASSAPSPSRGDGEGGGDGAAPRVAGTIFQTATNWIGKSEANAATQLNQFIRRWYGPFDVTSTPWCASWMNAVLGSRGIRGTGAATAVSFRNYGSLVWDRDKGGNIAAAARGDVGYFRRPRGTGHVAFIDSINVRAGTVTYVGGNQSDRNSGGQVSRSTLRIDDPKNGLMAVRRVGNGQAVPTPPDGGPEIGSPSGAPRIRSQVDVPSAEVAIAKKKNECNCPPPTIIGGGQRSGPNPLQYLRGIKPPTSAKPVSRNPVAEYRMYFAA